MNPPARDRSEMPGDKLGGDPNVMGPRVSEDLAHQDGRAEARESDRESARHDLLRLADDGAPEVPPGADSLVTWNIPAEETGHHTPEIPAEDEADVSATMAEEGSGEAEQELRRAANEETRPHHRPPHAD